MLTGLSRCSLLQPISPFTAHFRPPKSGCKAINTAIIFHIPLRKSHLLWRNHALKPRTPQPATPSDFPVLNFGRHLEIADLQYHPTRVKQQVTGFVMDSITPSGKSAKEVPP